MSKKKKKSKKNQYYTSPSRVTMLLDGLKQEKPLLPSFHRGDLWWVEADASTVTGKEIPGGPRPAIIVSRDDQLSRASTIMVVFLTTHLIEDEPQVHIPIHSAERPSYAICDKPTPLSVERFMRRIGKTTAREMQAVDAALCVAFSLDRYPRAPLSSEEAELPEVTDLPVDVNTSHTAADVDVEELRRENEMLRTELDRSAKCITAWRQLVEVYCA